MNKLKDILESLKELDLIIGKNSYTKKKAIIAKLILDTDGEILKFFDKSIKKRIKINKKSVAKALINLNYSDSTIDLKQIIKINEQLLNLAGKDSVSKKISLLRKIFENLPVQYRHYLEEYYRTGALKISFNEKYIIKTLKEIYPSLTAEIDKKSTVFRPYHLYHLFHECKNSSFEGQKIISPEIKEVPKLKPMLASPYEKSRLQKKIFYAEPKYDGFRVLIAKKNNILKIWSRSGRQFNTPNFNSCFLTYNKLLLSLPEDFLIDGEIYLKRDPFQKNGKGDYESFKILTTLILTKEVNSNYLKKYAQNIKLVVFDIIELGSISLKEELYLNRKKKLESLFNTEELSKLLIKYHKLQSFDDVEAVLKKAVDNGLEGVVLKASDSIYEAKRSLDWMKLKPKTESLDVVITNYSKGQGKYKDLYSSFRVGVLKPGFNLETSNSVVELGLVGSGFTEQDLITLTEKIKKKEKLPILEIEADSITKSKGEGFALRFPRFKRFRPELEAPNDLYSVLKFFKVSFKPEE